MLDLCEGDLLISYLLNHDMISLAIAQRALKLPDETKEQLGRDLDLECFGGDTWLLCEGDEAFIDSKVLYAVIAHERKVAVTEAEKEWASRLN